LLALPLAISGLFVADAVPSAAVPRLPAAAVDQVATLERVVRGIVRRLRRLALFGAAGAVPIVAVLGRDGFEALDGIVIVLLFAPAAIILFFAQSLSTLAALPERLRRIPGEGQERATELARLGGELRTARPRRLPLVLWRLRGAVGGLRDVAGIALPLRVLTPGFLGLTAIAAAASIALVLGGLVALVVLAAG
jgi:hypothetical protein